jgi:hypothetical protein
MNTCIQWTEPQGIAVERAKIRNQFRRSPLILISLFAVVLGIVVPVVIRVTSGTWHLPSSVVVGVIIGALYGAYQARAARFPAKQQEIELRTDGFTICGTAKFSLRYDQLRGYSIIYPMVEGVRQRLLTLYPRDDAGAFSIGIPATISDDAIRELIAHQIPFETIIDERALTII